MIAGRSLLEIQDLSADEITHVLDTAESFAEVNERRIKKLPTLRGRTIINLFLEPSTRTRMSFEIAAKRLSADGMNMTASASATVKGESLRDTAQTLAAMSCDLLVVRHKYAGSPAILADNMDCPIVNGGDGRHQHPTQALLDMYTMRKHLGRLQGLKVGIVGDIAHSRVAGSLVPGLRLMGAEPIVIAPPTLLPADPEALGAVPTSDLDSVLPELDVVYLLRIQMERQDGMPFPSLREYAKLFGMNGRRLRAARPDVLVMHPGPMNRGVEISAEVAESPNAAILDQVNAGVAVRMAVMYLILGGASDGAAA